MNLQLSNLKELNIRKTSFRVVIGVKRIFNSLRHYQNIGPGSTRVLSHVSLYVLVNSVIW